MAVIGFIGLGLIGGSLARALHKADPSHRILAYSPRTEETAQALSENVIDQVCLSQDPAYAECDFIFLCAPVQTNLTYLSFLKETARPDCILTDVGSVKGVMADAVRSCGLSARFIGGHPMAGTEKSGYEHSSDYLLENAWYFITPTEESAPDSVSRYHSLIESIHALPLVISPEQHDRIVAGVSHLPHIIASSLVNTVRAMDSDEEYMKLVAAGGFRDITRIASSSPDVWEQICLSNKAPILDSLDQFIRILEKAKKSIASDDGPDLHQMFTDSRNYRDSLDDTRRGSIARQYVLYVDIYDEAGGIATITTLLAMSAINIKNIGILHNREFEEGVLRIEFYDKQSRNHSEEILTKRNYVVRKKV